MRFKLRRGERKIEGFFEICEANGLTGQQGFLIPESNVQNLMLKEEVVEAIRASKFHIYYIKTIDEDIEILKNPLKCIKTLRQNATV